MRAGKNFLLYFTTLFSLSTIFAYDDISVVKRRMNFYKDILEKTNGSINVGFDPNQGLSCIAEKDLQLGMRTMRVPKRQALCPYWMFPFKFEIIEALKSIPQLVQTVQNEQKFGVFVMTYYILYVWRADKELIRDYVNANNLTDYLNVTEFDPRILDTFPKVMLGGATLDPDQYAILRELGYPIDKEYELDMVFRGVSQWINANSPHSEQIFPWISNVDDFKYAYGIIMSRGMTLRINEYKILEGITSTESMSELDKRNYEYSVFFARAAGSPCLVMFVDLCNHYQPKYVDMRDKHPIILDTEKGHFINSIPSDVSAGEEITYTYSNDPSNLILFLHYGFIIPKNRFNVIRIRVEDDFTFSINQFNLCRELGCLDSTIKDPLKVPKVRMYMIRYGELTTELLNLARIKYLKGEINYSKVLRTLTNDKPISNENEIKAWSYYLSHMKMVAYNRLSLEQVVMKIQKYRNRRNNFERNWDKSKESDLKEWKRLKNFELIYGLDVSYRSVILYQQAFSLKNVIKNLNNNIRDIKNRKYVKAASK